MIRNSTAEDFEQILSIINDAAVAYKGIIPPDRWHEPYMPEAELRAQIADGVRFSCYLDSAEVSRQRHGERVSQAARSAVDQQVVGVMGIQDKHDVELIRHAYVRTSQRKAGIGTQLLQSLMQSSAKPILIGTWNAADWAIRFYEKHGFALVSNVEKDVLLRKYWSIPERQVETSVVLADARYRSSKNI
jgi:N-acetylglutamate synthase-like GNAT family acetyltransferase